MELAHDRELRSAHEWALLSQDACNLSGIVHKLSEICTLLWKEARRKGEGTDWVNTHPAVRLFAEQIHFLASKRDYFKAYEICRKEAQTEQEHANAPRS